MARTRLSCSPATAIALLALFFALGGGSAFAVSESRTGTQQRTISTAVSRHNFDEALDRAARKVPASLRSTRLDVRYQIKASNPHIAEFWAIISTSG
ncbi:MAG: hypothetical protein ACRDNY_05260 [Gaiellaceae bacterium]